MARRIIIDTDPGQDDAVAILAALASPEELDVMAITAVAGNVPIERTVDNALTLVELADRADVPVYRGSARPMVKKLVTAEYVHGPTGIDGADLPPPTLREAPGHAVDRIVEILMSHDDVTLCTLGPLTNVGLALVREPAIAGRARQLVMMGGGFFEGGNTTPAAEFNVYVDPHAAHNVFTSGIPLVMMPLDVTHKALATPPRLERFRDLGTRTGRAVHGMLDFYDRWDMEKYGMEGGPVHDAAVIAYLLEPDIYRGKEVHVEIDIGTGPTQGMTIVDWWGVTGREANATVMNQVDDDRFFDLLIERIGRLS
ncbi:MAG: nucleoside hydrolase [Actinobacteria bacterium]|nr:nucleoside hydrolase [Actinomycetota bacterium]MCI0678169.1 nucleoside hydrolase [Actinomycetota bacterium]